MSDDFTADSLAFAKQMLAEIGIAATPGVDFDAERGSRYVRFCYAGTTADMAEAARRLRGWSRAQGEARADHASQPASGRLLLAGAARMLRALEGQRLPLRTSRLTLLIFTLSPPQALAWFFMAAFAMNEAKLSITPVPHPPARMHCAAAALPMAARLTASRQGHGNEPLHETLRRSRR